MEAVAAVGVAAAAVQFFEVAAKALQIYSEIRQSIKGESKANEELGKHVQELQKIQSSLNATLSGTDPQTRAVISIRQECSGMAKELLDRLQSVQNGRRGWRTSVQATFRTIHDARNIKALEQRYRDCQSKFQEALSVEMRNAIALVLQEQGRTNDTLLNIVLSGVNARFDQAQNLLEYKAFLDSLRFQDMFARHRNIDPPSKGTYEWVFNHDTEQDEEKRGKLGMLKRWLSSDEPYFWINGKAGSGKSSLMSFIESDKRTEDELKIWAGPHELYVFSFFFWRPGSDLQKSITGLLQSLLYQLAKRKPTVISRFISTNRVLMHSTWTETTLLRAIEEALSLYSDDSLFFLVDGLDEFEGSYLRILDTLFKLNSGPNIKICLSSRPETALVKRLSSFPSLRLQDLNWGDINSFVKQALQHQDAANDEIVYDVVHRSEGIFLWAVLVCKSLVTGFEAGDDEKTIQRRLDAIPTGLESLFIHMFQNIDDVHRDSLSVYFGLLKLGEASVALATIVLRNKPFETLQQYFDECCPTRHRIIAQSKGLIEVDESYDDVVDLRWAFADLPSGQIRKKFLDEATCKDFRRYESMSLRWVHRSAYDCIIDISSPNPAAYLLSSNQLDLARRTLAAAAWIAKHVPQLGILKSQPLIYVQSVVRTIIHLSEIHDIDLIEDVHQVLDELLETMELSLCAEGELVWRQVFSQRSITQSPRRPLIRFWEEVAKLSDLDRYFLPRFERLELSGFAPEPLGNLLSTITNRSPEKLPAVSYKILDALGRVSRGQSHYALGLGTAWWDAERGKAVCRYYLISFVSPDLSDDCAEEHMYMIFDLAKAVDSALRKLRARSHEAWYKFNTQLLELGEAWQVCYGLATLCEPGRLSPLQIQWPQVHAGISNASASKSPDFWPLTHASISNVPLPESLKLQRSRRTIRLLCLDSEQLATGPLVRKDVSKATACFDISEKCSEAIGNLVIDETSPLGRFVESMGQERCLRLILEDIWADQEKQLDAWQQLYMLACVKKGFKYFWVTGADT